MSTFYALPAAGSEVTLHTHLVVREDAHTLFGFASERERSMFRSLIRISGVGAKLALTILSGISADALVRCVRERDTGALTRLPGVGKKTAERLLVELADRLQGWDGGLAGTGAAPAPPPGAGAHGPRADALSALVALGYKPPEAERMVKAVAAEELASEEIIRRALQATVRR